jgi:hypothetical protein
VPKVTQERLLQPDQFLVRLPNPPLPPPPPPLTVEPTPADKQKASPAKQQQQPSPTGARHKKAGHHQQQTPASAEAQKAKAVEATLAIAAPTVVQPAPIATNATKAAPAEALVTATVAAPIPSAPIAVVDVVGLEERLTKEMKRIEASLGTRMDRTFQQLYERTKPEKDAHAKISNGLAQLQQYAEQTQRATVQALKDLQRDVHGLVPALTKAIEEKVAKLTTASLEKACEVMAPRLEAVAREAVSAAVTKQVSTANVTIIDAM